MPTVVFSRHIFIPLLVLLLSPPFVHCQEARGPSGSVAPSSYTYPDSTEGLRNLLQDVLAAAKAGDRPKLLSLVNQMEIPNYEAWFTKTYGLERGESVAGFYGRNLDRNERDFQELFMEFATQDVEISARKVNDALEPGRRFEFGMLEDLQQPVDIFFASWKKNGSSSDSIGDPIGYFVFVDGAFRWNSTIRLLRIRPGGVPNIRRFQSFPQDQTAGGPNNPPGGRKSDGSFTFGPGPANLARCNYCPSPEYPKKARAEHAEGSVLLQVIVQLDGRATDIEVLKTPRPDFAEKAIEAVQKWRFTPAIGPKGDPVATTVPIEMTFRLH
jgi:TonB family protein